MERNTNTRILYCRISKQPARQETVTLNLCFRTFRKQAAARSGIPAHTYYVVVFKLSRSVWLFVLSESSLLCSTDYQHTHFVLSHFQATCTVRKLSRSFWLVVLSESSLLHGTEYQHTRILYQCMPHQPAR